MTRGFYIAICAVVLGAAIVTTGLAQVYPVSWDSSRPPAPAPVPKTGQTLSYAAGDDGDLEHGVAWPNPRFVDHGDGTVRDRLTGLIWLKNADCFGKQGSWAGALAAANGLADPVCGLSDDSVAGDWRLANLRELHSLIDFSQTEPALPAGHPFTDVRGSWYWSSSTRAANSANTWVVHFSDGVAWFGNAQITTPYVWPVRGGQ